VPVFTEAEQENVELALEVGSQRRVDPGARLLRALAVEVERQQPGRRCPRIERTRAKGEAPVRLRAREGDQALVYPGEANPAPDSGGQSRAGRAESGERRSAGGFQRGSKMALWKRKAKAFWTVSFPR